MTVLQFILGIFFTWCIWEGGFDGFVTGIILVLVAGAATEFFSAKKAQADQEKALNLSATAAAYREWESVRWESIKNNVYENLAKQYAAEHPHQTATPKSEMNVTWEVFERDENGIPRKVENPDWLPM